jgi:hypothetical protein
MLMKLLISQLFLCFSVIAWSQNEINIHGQVTDAATNDPVEDCLVFISGTNLKTKTNQLGEYSLPCKSCSDTTTVTFIRMSYFDEVIPISKGITQGKRLKLDVALQYSSYVLNPVNITNAPDTVWGDDQLNVADFAFVKNNLLLLTYDHELRWKKQSESKTTLFEDCQLILLDENEKELTRCKIPGIAIRFYTKYLGEVFLQCREALYYVWFDEKVIHLEELSYDQFKENYEPVIDTSTAFNYLSNYSESFPEFYYMKHEKGDTAVYRFRRIIDEQMMEIFRSEYKYLDPRDKLEAFRYELRTGIDKEIVGGYMSGFANSIYYQPLNAPMFLMNDTLTLFDHHHNKIIRFDHEGDPIDSVSIKYHLMKKPHKWGGKSAS